MENNTLVSSYADACRRLKIEEKTEKDFAFLGIDAKRYWSRYQLTIIIRASNGDWEADLNNLSQRKYYIYCWIYGGGFSSYVSSYGTRSSVGSDLLIKDYDTATHIEKTFLNLYKDFLI